VAVVIFGMSDSYKTEGIVLRRFDFGEADKIIVFFTKHCGKISCLAKGVRRLSSRKRGNLEIFNRVSLSLIKGKKLDIVSEAEAIETYALWRKNLKKVAAAYEICEMVDKLTAENVEQEEIYNLLNLYLKKLENIDERNLPNFLSSFGQSLLVFLGFWPKNKNFPINFNIFNFVEQTIEKNLKSSDFLRKVLKYSI